MVNAAFGWINSNKNSQNELLELQRLSNFYAKLSCQTYTFKIFFKLLKIEVPNIFYYTFPKAISATF